MVCIADSSGGKGREGEGRRLGALGGAGAHSLDYRKRFLFSATFTCVVNNLGGYRVSGDTAPARVCTLYSKLSM